MTTAVLLGGCDDLLRYAPVEIIGLEMTSTAVVLAPGDTVTLRVFPVYGDYRDPWERPYPQPDDHWSSSDPTVAEVDRGRVRAVGPGVATLTADHRGRRDTATVVVREAEPDEPGVRRVSVGIANCLVTDADEVACWGSNTYGMIGVGDPRVVVNYLAPVRIPGARAVDVVAGRQIACYLDPEGAAHCWGEVAGAPYPRPVGAAAPFVSLSAGRRSACGLTAEGHAYCWGRDIGDVPVRRMVGAILVEIDGQCGRTTAGQVRCWGGTEWLRTDETDPIFQRIAAGFGRVCGLDAEGVAYCWGANYDGQLGTGPATDTCRESGGPDIPCVPDPAPVQTDLRFTDLAVGNGVICGVATDGRAYCWGAWNRSGALGTGDFEPRLTPAPVAGDRSFRSLSAQESSVCGVTTGGEAYCWGGSFPGDGRTWTYPPSGTTGTPAPVRVRSPAG